MNAKLRKKLTKVWKGHPEYRATLAFRNVVIHRFFDRQGLLCGVPCAYQFERKVHEKHPRPRPLMRKAVRPGMTEKACKVKLK